MSQRDAAAHLDPMNDETQVTPRASEQPVEAQMFWDVLWQRDDYQARARAAVAQIDRDAFKVLDASGSPAAIQLDAATWASIRTMLSAEHVATPAPPRVDAPESPALRGPDLTEAIHAMWGEMTDFAGRHSASLSTAAANPRDPAFAADWVRLIEVAATAYAATEGHNPDRLPQGWPRRSSTEKPGVDR